MSRPMMPTNLSPSEVFCAFFALLFLIAYLTCSNKGGR